MLTAQFYFHVFFMRHSMDDYPAMDVALTALLVACKAEETYKRIHAILEAAMQIHAPHLRPADIHVHHPLCFCT